ncbi:hypothetical protein CAEBREN_28958 [Caenorhabditis brenneri]|uniref:Uncharacterized protein n=1 Tax=Caenorhabditis brenneri TaxID=135651 RepID=G0M8P9_CAEBE|nr:hypothetical protein CAEBREN_28958 [Caenorhabditis brenneri]
MATHIPCRDISSSRLMVVVQCLSLFCSAFLPACNFRSFTTIRRHIGRKLFSRLYTFLFYLLTFFYLIFSVSTDNITSHFIFL